MVKQNITKDIFTVAGMKGVSPFDLQKVTHKPDFLIEAEKIPELNALNAIYVADPFVWIAGNQQYLFFELLLTNGKGVIGSAKRDKDDEPWSEFSIVLEEEFHLSYPIIFSYNGNLYMTVESAEADEVRVYEAVTNSLDEWRYVKGILTGKHYDPTMFLHSDMWYMFTCTELDFSVTNLYYSETLLGEWTIHPSSPIVNKDPGSARPAGPVMEWGEKKYRLAQDCSERYGAAVKAFEIIKLDQNNYKESEGITMLSSGKESWNPYGMHHLQIYKRTTDKVLVVTDGYHRI